MSRILGICGSMQAPSESRTWKVLQIALAGARRAGATIDVIQLFDLKLPMFEERMRLAPNTSEVTTLLSMVRGAEGLILASPVYHGTISGALKNCVDYFELLAQDTPPYMTNKVWGLMSVSGGIASTASLDPLYHSARALNAWVLPLTVSVSGNAFDQDRQLVDPQVKKRLFTVGQALTIATQKLCGGSTVEGN